MSEVRKFEMLRVARRAPGKLDWLLVFNALVALGFLRGFFGDGADLMCVLGILGAVWLYRLWAKRRPAKYLEITEEWVRGPLGWRKWGEIPRDQVEEVVPTTEGLIIAWKKDGVPWYMEVMEMWFSADEWEKVRAALLEWGDRGDREVEANLTGLTRFQD
jgi:hypothetical protein